MIPPNDMLRFGPFELDPVRAELRDPSGRLDLHERPLRVLAYLIEHRDRVVTREELLAEVWPDSAVTEASVATAVVEIRRALGDDPDTQQWVRTVRGEGFRFVGTVNDGSGPAAQPVRWWWLGAAAVLAAGLVGIGWGVLQDGAISPSPKRSIVVLPFDDLSPDGDQAHLALGITDELTHTLAQVPELRVLGTTTGRVIKERGLDIREIGEETAVDTVVEGSVRREGNRLRLTVQLITVEDNDHLWSQTFDRPVVDVLDLQEELARAIAQTLEVEILGRPRTHGARNAEAYQLYLAGYVLVARYGRDELTTALDYFERALALDPDYAAAYVGLADAHYGLFEWTRFADEVHRERSAEAARRALELDPDLAAVHAIEGWLASSYDDYGSMEAIRKLTRAIELDPSLVVAWRGRAIMYEGYGWLDLAGADLERARALDPVNPSVLHEMGRHAYYSEDYERALELLTRARDLGYAEVLWLSDTYSALGRYEESIHYEIAYDRVPEETSKIIMEAFEAGGIEAARRKRLELSIQRAGGDPCTSRAGRGARQYARLGDADRMFQCQEIAYRSCCGPSLFVDPMFLPYRQDPRYQAYVEQAPTPARP